MYENKGVVLKDDRVSFAIDSNRVTRTFNFSCILSAANFILVEGYLRPASAPDYTAATPQFVKVYYDATNSWANVKVIGFLMGARMIGSAAYWRCTFKFIERTTGVA